MLEDSGAAGAADPGRRCERRCRDDRGDVIALDADWRRGRASTPRDNPTRASGLQRRSPGVRDLHLRLDRAAQGRDGRASRGGQSSAVDAARSIGSSERRSRAADDAVQLRRVACREFFWTLLQRRARWSWLARERRIRIRTTLRS